MADRVKVKEYAQKFLGCDERIYLSQNDPEVVQKEKALAQSLYDEIQPFDFDACQMGVDGILFDLGVQLRPDDSLLTRANSPWVQADMKRMGQKEVIQGELTWITIESYEEYEGHKFANPLVTRWQYTAQYTFSQVLEFQEGFLTKEEAIAAAQSEIKIVCDCEIEALQRKIQQWEAAKREQGD